MARLLNRSVAVTLAKPIVGSFFNTQPNAIVITDLRVRFSIVKTIKKEPNTCDVTLTNLAERTVAEFQRKPLHVRIDAGHDGNLERVFTGDLRWGEMPHEGTEREAVFQLGDGDRAFRYGRVSRSYRSGVDAYTAVLESVKGLGFKTSDIRLSAGARNDLRAQFAGGLVLHGPASQELSRVLAPYGLSWSIQDGRLQILRADEYRNDLPILINQAEGMIGRPQFGPPTKKGAKPVLTIKTLLRPSLTPGGRIDVESESIGGVFKIQRVMHSGDTEGEDWYSEVEATPV